MIIKYYAVTCDKCKIYVVRCKIKRPTNEELNDLGIYRKGKKHYCDSCMATVNWAKRIKEEIK